jgi:hypothetical protein
MLRRKTKLWMLTMSLGIGAVVQSGCGNTIRVIPSPDQPDKLILNPQQNDVIEWQADVNPSFLGPAPCAGGQPQGGKCKVNETAGKYLYSCSKCKDPEVVVGSDIPSGIKHTISIAAGAAMASDAVSVWCNNNQVAVAPAEVDFTPKSGDTVQTLWVNTGNGSSFIKDWQVNFTGTSPCLEAQIGAGHDNTCTFNASASATYTYTAKSSSGECNQTTAAGTIKVTVQ